MKIRGTEIVDTFAEAFEMVCAKVIITAKTDDLAIAAANSMTGRPVMLGFPVQV